MSDTDLDDDYEGIVAPTSEPPEEQSQSHLSEKALMQFAKENENPRNVDLEKDSYPSSPDSGAKDEAMRIAAQLDEEARTGERSPPETKPEVETQPAPKPETKPETKPEAEAEPKPEGEEKREAPAEIDADTAALLTRPISELKAEELAQLPIELTPRGSDKSERISLGDLQQNWLNVKEHESAMQEMGAHENVNSQALTHFEANPAPEIQLLDSQAEIAKKDLGVSGGSARAIKAEIAGLEESLANIEAEADREDTSISASDLIKEQGKIRQAIATQNRRLDAVHETIETQYATHKDLQHNAGIARIDGSFKAAFPKSVDIHDINKRGKVVGSMVEDAGRLYGLNDNLANQIAEAALLHPAVFSILRAANTGAKTRFAGSENTAAKKAAAPLRIGGGGAPAKGKPKSGGATAQDASDAAFARLREIT